MNYVKALIFSCVIMTSFQSIARLPEQTSGAAHKVEKTGEEPTQPEETTDNE